MESLALILFYIFLIGIIVSIVCLVISFIKKDFKFTKKQILISLLICFIGFIASTIFFSKIQSPESKARYEQQQKEKEEAKKQKEALEKAKEEEKTQKETDKQEENETKSEENKEVKTENVVDNSDETVKQENESENNIDINKYDDLQKLYMNINSDMSFEECLKIVIQSGLPYAIHNFNGSKEIKVAFEKGVLPDKHADSGDHLEISFEENKEDNSFIFGNIQYFNQNKFITIFEYKDGAYWDFNKGNDAGLYINNYKKTMGTKEEKYIKADSKVEQLKYLINYTK